MTTSPYTFDPPDIFLGESSAIARLRLQVARMAPHFRVALLTGEPGTGKQAVAHIMHSASPAASLGPLTVCPLSEFIQTQPATSGTLYLPGLESLPADAQLTLLRLLKTLPRETRVILASQVDLRGMVSAGRMRPDLYERVGTLHFRIPPLRDRLEDLAPLSTAVFRHLNSSAHLSPEALLHLEQHTWPGNLRELAALCQTLAPLDTEVLPLHLPGFVSTPSAAAPTARLDEVMQRHVLDVLESCAGNKLRAAEILGISRSTLYRMLGNQQAA